MKLTNQHKIEAIQERMEVMYDNETYYYNDIQYLLQRLERYENALSDIAFGRVEGDYSDVKYFARESLNEE